MKQLRKWIAVLLTVSMTVSIMPISAFAKEAAEEQQISVRTLAEENETVESSSGEASQETEDPEVAPEPEPEAPSEPEQTGEVTSEEENEISQEPSLASIPPVGDRFADAFIDVLNKAGITTTITNDESGITLTIGDGDGRILELLSQQEQTADSNYQNWNIYFSSTGNINLSDEYLGLGDPDFPFMGKFTGQSITIISSKTIFKALGAQADLNGVRINWKGASDTPILARMLVADEETRKINMPLANASKFSPYIGQLTGGIGSVKLPTLNYSVEDSGPSVEYSGDVGIVCGSMDANTKLQVDTLTLPKTVTLNLKGSGNVGSLVGIMESGAELTISKSLTLSATLQGRNTGGLVGSMSNASIRFGESVSVSVSADLTATEAAGGIGGAVTTGRGPLGENANVVLQSVKAKGTNHSGVLYGNCTVTGEFNPFAGINFGENAVKEVSGPGSCGGVFGTLALEGDGKCSLSAAEDQSLELSTSLKTATNVTAYGGVTGTLNGAARKNALVVDKCIITSSIDVGNNPDNYPQYIGGIVAKQTTATVDAKNTTITVNSPKIKDATNYGFGGLVAKVGDGALLIADTMIVITDSYLTNPRGGGVAGYTGKGSIVYLKTSLNLSKCQLTSNATSGQIVGSQDCSLVYAPGVAITRLQTGTYNGLELDDIGNYGELYRVEEFLDVNKTTYATEFRNKLKETNGEYQLSTSLDYACLALAWQSRGYFATVDGINNSTWDTLQTSKIKLGDNLNMTGCGVGGLTRDVSHADDTFSGVFNGNNHKIILGIGAENQANTTKVTKGDGRIYWHNATGLFAGLSSSATVQNLTLAGSVRINNSKGTMHVGGLAALLSGGSSGGMIEKVSTEVSFDAVTNGGTPLYMGGLVGLISNTGYAIPRLNLVTGTTLEATVSVTHSGDGRYNHIGGTIGAVDTNANVNVTCTGATIKGSINYTNTPNNIYAGGLVGTIFPGDSKQRTISITSLTVDGFSLTGSAKERMGGILGGIWADTDVTVNGLTVKKATLTASGKAALGGLVYRASGKWTVTGADLSGLTIKAEKADALGVFVCRGGSYKELINSSYSNVDGLYLEIAEDWEWDAKTNKGYNVPNSITFGNGVFDEFVAYTAYADRNSNTPDYQITANGSGIISLKTANGTVNMTESARNTYVNRTTVGRSKQTNLYSRYYYNLPEVKNACDGGDIDTSNELLIWSVYRYAASNLKKHFHIENVTKGTIGGTADIKASFDMHGLSYYPINITNTNVTVQYANVKFYNDEIEKKEVGNKLTRGDENSHSQHYTMHCALFLDYIADLKGTAEYENRTMTVNGVSFAGSVGVVDGGSGALICGTVRGDTQGGNTSICTVILADADDVGKAVSLNGLSVVPEGDYTPVLINKFGSYAGLKANYITTTDQQTTAAGSSLIGNVGGQGATNVSVEFAGTIKLPESGVFTKAILLNSLRYENGSATYRFYKSKDYDGNEYLHNATHGQELSTTVEYVGKQGCYYDGYGPGYYVSKNNDFKGQNDFSSYLPYVALSPASKGDSHTLADGWHELAVNVLSSNLTEGCGTYGHPYQVDANLFKEAANYVNTGVASIGWQVRVSVSENYHTTYDSEDVLLTWTENGWQKEDSTGYDGNVRQYLQSAYYEIKEDIELSNFNGIGTDQDWAFTGVIKGKNASTTVTLSEGTTAFIKYSYGSVVRDLTIEMNQSPTLNREPWTRGTAEQAPNTFFGGVIGCVLGGDNIIENVIVKSKTDFDVKLTGTGTHLIPMGGYVGVIAGGGLIFRGSCSDNTGVTGTDAKLYQNPIIGRVLGGYAFYEGTGTAPNNGDRNYKINTITSGADTDLSWNDDALILNNAQGLLLLSAIVSSGAGSSSSNAYTKGKARNAAYDKIGEVTEPIDYTQAKKDAGEVWADSNIPYLLSKYVGGSGSAEVCSNENGIAIEFAQDTTFDMVNYKNGYRGLSARYVSNAAFETSGVDASNVVMRVSTFNGMNADVQNINMNVREYEDDDFHAASLGGIFNIVWTKKQSGGTSTSIFAQNLTLTNCNVSLQYIDTKGGVQEQANTSTFSDADGLSCVTVGGFIGSVSDIDVTPSMSAKTSNYLFSGLHINSGKIKGPNSAGGLIGASAMTNSTMKGYPGVLLSNSKNTMFGPSFLNCSYTNIEVTAKLAAGGLTGYVFAGGDSSVPQFTNLGITNNNNSPGCYASCTVTEDNFTTGQNSTICAEARRGVAGGILGAAGMRVQINDTNVNSKTGLNISSNQIEALHLNTVNVQASTKDEYILREGNTKNGPTSQGNHDDAAAAGIVGRIGSVNPTGFYDIYLGGCSILTGKWADSSTINNYEYAGGIVGYGYTNTSITIQRCQIVENSKINSKNSGGFLGYGYNASGFILHMSDSKIEDTTVYGDTYSGGLVGKAAGKYYLFNILIKNTSIEGPNTGRLFGWMNINAAGNDFEVNAAGISVFADKNNVTIPEVDGKTNSGKNYIGYISYADYAGTETEVSDQRAPYVTVNPNFTLTGENKQLTGDAVGKVEGDTCGSVAARIWRDSKSTTPPSDKKNKVSYQNATTIVNKTGNAEPTVSTFYVEQGCGPYNLPVLVLKGTDAGVIEDYLNVITNGGYSEALQLSNPPVEISDPEVYYYDEGTGGFRKASPDELAKEPASIYKENGKLNILGSSFDNTRNRFTLVEASFKVKVNGKDRIYMVSIPVVVTRELQYNFMSTFSYGAEFNADTFNNLKTHVLESTGNPFTAYLTYQYNREREEYVDYDWQGYMDDGGSMLDVDKILSFSSGLPRGTQLTLVDCQNGNRAYQYETTDEFTSTKTDIPLSSFTSVTNGASFQASMAEILGVIKSKNNTSGKYVETDLSRATVRLKNDEGGYTYYRPIAEGEEAEERYDLTVPNLMGRTLEENYYLVINVPNQGDGFYINGSLSSSLRWTMPSKGTWLHRYNKSTTPQVGNNDESTYQISTGYKQVLSSTANAESINLASADKKMQVKARDTITFSNQQVYGDNDQLFMKLTVDLQEHTADSQDVTEIQFPAGTTGKVHFYIQDVEESYYVFDGTSWSKNQEGAEAASYDWISQGANMELLLSKDGRTALDLSGVRKLIKGNQSSGDSQIIITAEMDIDFNSQEVLNATIPGSEKNGADKWVQLHYTGRISTQAYSLGYSTVRAVAEDNAKYYRGVRYEAILSMDATSISQLGINPLELVPEYLTTIDGRKASRIDLIAALNLANLQDIEGVLANTESITFSLSLTRGGKGSYETEVADASNYVGFDLSAYGSPGWSWTIPKEQFYQNGQIVKSNIFDGTQFTMPITAYVFTNQKDFANYKINLIVRFNGENRILVEDKEAYVVYTFACIKPEFYDPREHTNSTTP